ncbi:rhomboid family protein [Mangrovimonas aestuarii]|uniref:rhomboid family protein n=1 Tax=Mangrovimonas aestuarii TaxID=3018443 RepID=UPI002379313E|nr:rhomboid family intramembrane serine protease [Mangrovimonas aestuarii]
MSFIDDLKYKYTRLNVLEKLIAINGAIFIIGLLLKLFSSIVPGVQVLRWFELPSDFFEALKHPWSIISYGFVHYDFLHILFNMLWLYFIGRMFMNLFNPKTGLNVYLLGVIIGGLIFLAGYNIFPSFFSGTTRLVGASAGVRALLIFLCVYMPHQEVRFFTFNIKLWYIGGAILFFDFIGLFGLNAGGNLAHLGGAMLGYFYADQLKKGNDIGKGFERLMDWITSLFKRPEKSPLKTVHRKQKNGYAGYSKKEFDEFNTQKRVDIILDKISKSGYDSLTKEEKEFLFKAGK